MSEIKLTLRVIELGGGGFVLAEEMDTGEICPLQAVSSIDEACGVVQRRVREWNSEAVAYRKSQRTENVIRPKRFWPSLFSRIEDQKTGT